MIKKSFLSISVLALFLAMGACERKTSQTDQAEQSSQTQQQPVPPSQDPAVGQQQSVTKEDCKNLKDNAKDICEAQAEGQKKVSEAQAKVTERDTPKNRLELGEVQAEADYNVAMEYCDDQVGDLKKACQEKAKATRENAEARAKIESQSPESTSSGSGIQPETQSEIQPDTGGQ